MSHTHDEHHKRALEHLQRRAVLLQDRITVLEEENTALAAMLRERGVEVHRASHIHLALPPPFTSAAPGNPAEIAMLTHAERRLFDELGGEADTLLLLLSESMVDVGRWLWRSRVWVGATATELTSFAAGRRPLLQRLPFRHLQESLYNHVTGELVLAPNRKFALARIQMAPVEAYQFLAQIYAGSAGPKETPHA